jgi:hypothetical protein
MFAVYTRSLGQARPASAMNEVARVDNAHHKVDEHAMAATLTKPYLPTYKNIYQVLGVTKYTFCESVGREVPETAPSILSTPSTDTVQSPHHQHQQHRHQVKDEDCIGCLITGVATCTFLSGYFGYLAYEDILVEHDKKMATSKSQSVSATIKSLQSTLRKTKQRPNPYFLAISGVWVVVGAYRLYLG